MKTVAELRALARAAARNIRAAVRPYPSRAQRAAAAVAALEARRGAELRLAATHDVIDGNARALAAAIVAFIQDPSSHDAGGAR
jgi:hypothetical protein